ncbi:MAG TPA: cyclic nucleotide-binding domain-containing protein [Solirubrobacteraceae bacterium]|nr:cyclic nucleotide-binding domain-containing protein [Solirubrobacteraceae bacterium]
MRRHSVGPDGPERLARIPLFADLSPAQRNMLARLVDEVAAAAGETIMAEGGPGYEFMILEQGAARVLQGGEEINTMGPGDFFGELAVLGDGAARSASVIATSDARGLVFTARFTREIRERLPLVRERIDAVAEERLRRDAQRASR